MLKQSIQTLINKFGYAVQKIPDKGLYYDIDREFFDIYEKCKTYTMTSIERMYALYKSIEYIVKSEIPGSIVECGVWRGGSAMICAYALKKFGDTRREIFLYDTYEGMSAPTYQDIYFDGQKAESLLNKKEVSQRLTVALDIVKQNLYLTGYPEHKIYFIKGKVEDTIPAKIPDAIALLRLDTDWYESTYHELCHLYPKLVTQGVVIIDDYGCWQGAKEATDKYFNESKIHLLLHRIDVSGRIGIKTCVE